jgi:FAD/FMN-containing dehydrogenase
MRNKATTPMALRDFRASLHGEVILPDDHGYDSAHRVWNGMIDKYPAMIIRCANRADVTHAVEFARSQHLPVAVRGGGHSVSGKSVCDGGIVIDLSQMKACGLIPLHARLGPKPDSHWANSSARHSHLGW